MSPARTRSTHETTVDFTEAWLGLCYGDGDAWNIPQGKDNPIVERAIHMCRACPALRACQRYTRDLIDRGMRPIGLVQAGQAFPAKADGREP